MLFQKRVVQIKFKIFFFISEIFQLYSGRSVLFTKETIVHRGNLTRKVDTHKLNSFSTRNIIIKSSAIRCL